MKVTIKENLLEVVTGIKKEDFDKQVTDMIVKDEDGTPVFKLDCNDEGDISKKGLVCNTTVDGLLAVTLVIPMAYEATVDDIKVIYGKALVNAEKNLAILEERIKADSEAIDKIFPEETTEG